MESTARFAMELGYHVTLVRDATAAFSPEMMRAAHELNGPTFAHSIVSTAELLAALPAWCSTYDEIHRQPDHRCTGLALRARLFVKVAAQPSRGETLPPIAYMAFESVPPACPNFHQ
ncbi:isochorismatase family protein [Paraburkholderia fungorum]|uniref:isochorismatase family protein n=1 Tax=Paraburkholderia fungorum TaxID=134537 RepID=UPI0038BA65D2